MGLFQFGYTPAILFFIIYFSSNEKANFLSFSMIQSSIFLIEHSAFL